MADVRIPVSADPSGAVSAFNQIRDAIQRAGQEGREFAKLDLDHPELKELAEDLQRLNSQFQTLRRLPGWRERLADVPAGQAPWDIHWQQQFSSPEAAQRNLAKMTPYLTGGTRWDVPNAPPPAAQSWRQSLHEHAESRRERRREQRGLVGDLFDSIPGSPLFKGALGLAGLGGAMALVGRGVGDATTEYTELTDLRRRLGEVAEDFQQFRGRIAGAGEGLGVTRLEALRLSEAFAHASGEVQQLPERVEDAIGFARGMGLDPEQVAPWLGRASFLGVTGERGSMSDRELVMLLGGVIGQGEMFGKADEVMASLERYTSQIQQQTLRAPNLEEFARLRTAMYQSDVPGLRTEAGDALLQQVDAAIRAAAQDPGPRGHLIHRALGDPNLDMPQIERILEHGIFATPRGVIGDDRLSDKTLWHLLHAEMERSFASMPESYRLGMQARQLNIGQEQYLALDKVMRDLQSAGGDGLTDFKAVVEAAGIDIASMDVTAIGDLARIATADPDELLAMRRQYLEAHGDDAMAGAEAALLADDTRQLRIELAKVAAEFGMVGDAGSEWRETTARMRSELAEAAAKLVPVFTAMKGVVADVTEGMNNLLGAMESGPGEAGDAAPDDGMPAWRRGIDSVLGWKPFADAQAAIPEPDALSAQAREGKTPAELIGQGDIRVPTLPALIEGHRQTASKIPSPPGGWTRANAGRFDASTPEYHAYLDELASQYGIPYSMLPAVMHQESGGRGNAVSPAGAQGLFQFMPGTARDFKINPWDPYEAAEGAARYFQRELHRFEGDIPLALAAYNAGPGNVQKYGGIPPFRETRNYVTDVARMMAGMDIEPAIAITEAARSPSAFQRLPSAPGTQADVPQLRLPDEGASLGAGGVRDHRLGINLQILDPLGRSIGGVSHDMGLSSARPSGSGVELNTSIRR